MRCRAAVWCCMFERWEHNAHGWRELPIMWPCRPTHGLTRIVLFAAGLGALTVFLAAVLQ